MDFIWSVINFFFNSQSDFLCLFFPSIPIILSSICFLARKSDGCNIPNHSTHVCYTSTRVAQIRRFFYTDHPITIWNCTQLFYVDWFFMDAPKKIWSTSFYYYLYRKIGKCAMRTKSEIKAKRIFILFFWIIFCRFDLLFRCLQMFE